MTDRTTWWRGAGGAGATLPPEQRSDVRRGRPKRRLVPALIAVLGVVAGLATTAAQAQTLAYVTNAGDDTVSVIDTATNTVTATVNVGRFPNDVAVTPDGARAYMANFFSDTVSVIDTATNTVVATVNVEEFPTGVAIANVPTTPETLTLTAAKDSFLRKGAPNRNEGANPGLRIRASGNNRVVVGFDPDAIADFGTVTAATLVLTIAENADNWGRQNDRTVDAHPLAADFAEGNGQGAGVPGSQSTRGSGPGVTWRCAVDDEIANQATDCDPRWDGGDFGPATAAPVLHVNGLTGEVSWDVTDDVLAGASAWLLKKTAEGQSGKVLYH